MKEVKKNTKKSTTKKETVKSSQTKSKTTTNNKNIKKETKKVVKKSSIKAGDDKMLENNNKLSSVKKKSVNKKLILPLIVLFIGIFMLVLNASYAFFTTQTTSKNYVVYTGTLQVDYEKVGNVIELNNVAPMTNNEGLATTGHSFRVANNGTLAAKYQVRLEVESDVNKDDKKVEYIPLEYIKLAYSTDGTNYSEAVRLSDLDENLVFVSNRVIAANAKDNYTIKLWIDYSAPNEVEKKIFKAKVVVDAIQSQDSTGIVADAKPIINLKKDASGNKDINLVAGATYTELGVESVEDDLDKLDKSNVTMTYEYFNGTTITDAQGVNTAQNGVYYITYTITDSGNNTGTAIRVVTVNIASTLPTISLVGSNNMSIEQYTNYTEPGVTVTNNNKVVTLGDVKATVPGVYTVKYVVIDSNNNMNSVTRTVTVTEAQEYLLSNKILADNNPVKTTPLTLTTSAEEVNESGLYSMSVTNGFGGGNGTSYFFRGDVNNNVVEFAGKIWRIIRVNEDGTIRLILDESIDTNTYAFNSNGSGVQQLYYTNNSTAKTTLESWYNTNIGSNSGLDSLVANGNYFCEQARVKYASGDTSGSATMTTYNSYTPNLQCQSDGNGKGLVNTNIGLITYDEMVLAGGYYYPKTNNTFYLYKNANNGVNDFPWWSMSPVGLRDGTAPSTWGLDGGGNIGISGSNGIIRRLRPVINLKADTVVTKRPYNSTYPYIYVVENNPPTPVSFATDSWTTIVANVKAGNGDVYAPTNNGVDNQVLREVNLGSLGTHYLRVANTTPCTNGETSQTACGFVVEFADIITTRVMNDTNTNAGGYPASSLFTYLNTDVYNALPQDIKNIMIPTTVVSGHGYSDSNNFTTLNQKLYLLSRQEILGDNDGYDTAINATRQLDYYSKNNNSANRIKKSGATANVWWTRTPISGSTNSFNAIGGDGDLSYNGASTPTIGISPAFRIG